MDRRDFLKLGGMSAVALGFGGALTSCLQAPDANGLRLQEGFTSRVIATTGQQVASTGYVWHDDPDGGACFTSVAGGWIYVSNSESFSGGASMVRFAADGSIVEARSILDGTVRNCAGGATPWGTWLSCEEISDGQIWECDPTGVAPAAVRPEMGTFNHEAAAADPVSQVIYLTEDRSDGAFYRFIPTTWGDLSSGTLQVLVPDTGEQVDWATVLDPSATTGQTRHQVPATIAFNGGEGAVMHGTDVVFATKGDNRLWRYSPTTNSLSVIYDLATSINPILAGVDNVTERAGHLYVAEDGGDMQIVRLSPRGNLQAMVQADSINGSELTGVAFNPTGDRMYFSSQRNPGTTYEVAGPWP